MVKRVGGRFPLPKPLRNVSSCWTSPPSSSAKETASTSRSSNRSTLRHKRDNRIQQETDEEVDWNVQAGSKDDRDGGVMSRNHVTRKEEDDVLCQVVQPRTRMQQWQQHPAETHLDPEWATTSMLLPQEEADFLLATRLQKQVQEEEELQQQRNAENQTRNGMNQNMAVAGWPDDGDHDNNARKKRSQDEEAAAAAAAAAADDDVAYRLQLNLLKEESNEQECMRSSSEGRAWLLVRQVMEFFQEHEPYFRIEHGVDMVAMDDMVYWAKNFLECQEEFRASGRPHLVTLAYHYTDEARMESIREQSLMTPADRRMHVGADGGQRHGGVYGGGIYVGSNPFAFSSYGSVGLLVAVLYGKTCRVRTLEEGTAMGQTHDTLVGNKLTFPAPPNHDRITTRTAPILRPDIDQDSDENASKGHFHDEFVLQSSRQCLPLFRFPATLPQNASGDDWCSGNYALWKLHQGAQTVMDTHVNSSPTQLFRIFPSHAFLVKSVHGWGAVTRDQTRYPQTANGSGMATIASTHNNNNHSAASPTGEPSRRDEEEEEEVNAAHTDNDDNVATSSASSSSASSPFCVPRRRPFFRLGARRRPTSRSHAESAASTTITSSDTTPPKGKSTPQTNTPSPSRHVVVDRHSATPRTREATPLASSTSPAKEDGKQQQVTWQRDENTEAIASSHGAAALWDNGTALTSSSSSPPSAAASPPPRGLSVERQPSFSILHEIARMTATDEDTADERDAHVDAMLASSLQLEEENDYSALDYMDWVEMDALLSKGEERGHLS